MPSESQSSNTSKSHSRKPDLSLQGDKIRLESRSSTRPISTASAKCSYLLQGSNRSARPVSAVPMLSLYQNNKDDYELSQKLRRPYSADNLNVMGSRHDRIFFKQISENRMDKLTNSYSSLRSIEEIDKDSLSSLPSTELLRTLIDESIVSWSRNPVEISKSPATTHSRQRSVADEKTPPVAVGPTEEATPKPTTINDTAASTRCPLPDDMPREKGAGATTPLADSDHSALPQTTSQQQDDRFVPMSSDLTPGVKHKPPLPPQGAKPVDTSRSQGRQNSSEPASHASQWSNDTTFVEELEIDQDEIAVCKSEAQTDLHLSELNKRTRRYVWRCEPRSNRCDSELLLEQTLREQAIREEDELSLGLTEHDTIIDVASGSNAEPMFVEDREPLPPTDTPVSKEPKERNTPMRRPQPKSAHATSTSAKSEPRRPSKTITKKPPNSNTSNKTTKGKTVAKRTVSRESSEERIIPSSQMMDDTESWMTTAGRYEDTIVVPSITYLNAPARQGPPVETIEYIPSIIIQDNIEYMTGPTRSEMQLQQIGCQCTTSETLMNDDLQLHIDTWESENETCEDIEAILEVLEQESKKSHEQIQSIKRIVNTELQATINARPVNCANAKSVAMQVGDVKLKSKFTMFGRRSSHQEDSEEFSLKEKLRQEIEFQERKQEQTSHFNQILSYLDQVERSNIQAMNVAKGRFDIANQLIASTLRVDTVPNLEDLLSHSQMQLANQLIDLNIRLKEKTSSIQLLQDELVNVRDVAVKAQKQAETIIKEKLKVQKEESDSVIKRHQKFIDQLMADKKVLQEQCEGLLQEMRANEERCHANMRALEHKHVVEMKKAKDMQIASEKLRRERWLDTKTQKIKELTVKSIEPELQAMTVRHERELSELRALHKRELEDIEISNARKSQQQMEALREQLTEERERALTSEREHLRARYESMMEAEEQSYNEQRKRLMNEHTARMNECEQREQIAYAERDKCIAMAREECEEKLRVSDAKHAYDLEIAKENSRLEMEKWKCAFLKQQEAVLNAKEEDIREACKKERDREIENVINRLEGEMQTNKVQVSLANETRVKRLKEKYETEIKDLEASESEYKEKYLKLKGKLVEFEELIASHRSTITHLEAQLANTSEKYQELAAEEGKIRENVKEEMHQEMLQLQQQVDSTQREKDAELAQVFARVKVTVQRKDQMLAELSRDYTALKDKCNYLENMLDQQRKEYYIK